jgi:hypothetical protein
MLNDLKIECADFKCADVQISDVQIEGHKDILVT